MAVLHTNVAIHVGLQDPTSAIQDDARPTKRRKQLPLRFRVAGLQLHDKRLKDILPQPVPALPPPGMDVPDSSDSLMNPILTSQHRRDGSAGQASGNPPASVVRRIHDTAKNSFGLFRRYFAETFPSHDPESEVNVSSLSDIIDSSSPHSQPPDTLPSFRPYPNQNSFLLGDWYWNRGAQKSQQDFRELLAIVGDDDFRPTDVQKTNWDRINDQLALNDWDKEEWIDEDAGWRTSPVTISAPFHRFTDRPGARDYTAATFHYRSLISVIREKLVNSIDNRHFHYEPYELVWKPTDNSQAVRVHGELYTSPAFIDAHCSLQNSPLEPGCDLPRIVVALMFWSDSTHLTNFGNTKLWPLYMFFRNESKYRRCKPSCNVCEHVAYFETV
jgi:Plavaka transposase